MTSTCSGSVSSAASRTASGGQRRARNGSLRRHLRRRRPPGGGRRRHRCPGHLHPRPQRDGHAARLGPDRPGRNLLGRPGRGLLLRLQRRERLGQRLPTRARAVNSTCSGPRPTDPGTVDAAASPGGRSSSMSRPVGTGSSTGSRSMPTAPSPTLGSVTVPGAVGGEGIATS